MADRMQETARRVAESYLATFAARTVQLVGIPVLLAGLYWAAGQVTALAQRMTVMEHVAAAGRVEIIDRIQRLEASDLRDREALSTLARQIATVDATAHAILREIETMRREAIVREQRR